MFVAFEGIDGSGKSAISERVAEALRGRGLDVLHVRSDGVLASPLSEEIRSLCRVRQHLAMEPITELLLCAAREAQLLCESVAPELDARDVIMADRSLHSWAIQARCARGLDGDRVEAICDAAAPLWPDLVIVLDADPQLAKARRKASKIRDRGQPKPPNRRKGGRKKLAGAAYQRRMRRGFLDRAAADPDRWVVFDNSEAGRDLDSLAAEIAELIVRRKGGEGVAAAPASARAAAPPESKDPLDWARDRFYAWVEERAASEPDVAAYFLAGVDDARAYEWRRRLAAASPEVVADGLRGLAGDEAWRLREELAEAAPHQVARSTSGRELLGDPRVAALRRRLVDQVPEAVLGAAAGDDDEPSWELRRRLAADYPTQVVASTRGIDSAEAWALRRRLEAADDRDSLAALVSSVRGLEGDEAWELRERARELAPAAMIRSLWRLESDRAWQERERYIEAAPRPVFATLSGSIDPRAWTLRRSHLESAKEAIDSIARLEVDEAWELRVRAAPLWPSTVVKSLVGLELDERGRALVAELIRENADDLSLLKHATRIAARRRST